MSDSENKYIKMYREGPRKTDYFANDMGLVVTDADLGYAKGEMEIKPRYRNPMKRVHGAVPFTVADTLGGIAVMTYGRPWPTINASVDFLRSFGDSEKIIGEARVIKNGRRIKTVDVSLYDDAQRLCMKCLLQYFNAEGDSREA